MPRTGLPPHLCHMVNCHETPNWSQSEQRELLDAGRAVLLSLGEGRLAREYCRQAAATSSREELTELLLTCLASRRSPSSRRPR
ncbi:hypothetical protein [Solidesulfovibrio aerotolerans]|nr:hypothetical protein [Solidesulfovibrio aerotolerans]